jgi:hypothetical protein
MRKAVVEPFDPASGNAIVVASIVLDNDPWKH